jgi:hypothetical protein
MLTGGQRDRKFFKLFWQAHERRSSYANAFLDALEAKIQDVIHILRLAKVGTRDELGLLGSRGGCIGQDGIADLDPYLANFAILEDVDDETDLAMSSVAGLP